MVRHMLSSMEDLRTSGYGRPPPRHGLLLLFWFAKNCVTFNPNGAVIMVAGIQPEIRRYGFHYFRNFEAILPALPVRAQYYEVGNLNTETYPNSADLPGYVRESYATSDGYLNDSNADRLIICYKAKARMVIAVYVTEHLSGSSSGKFDPHRTHAVSPKLIRALQNTQVDLDTFLIQVGYRDEHDGFNGDYPEPDYYIESANFRESHIYPEPVYNIEPANYTEPSQYNAEPTGREELVGYTEPEVYWEIVQAAYRRDQRCYSEPGDGNGSGKWRRHVLAVLLGAGALYVAVKCLSSVSSSWRTLSSGTATAAAASSAPSITEFDHCRPVMLDYVF